MDRSRENKGRRKQEGLLQDDLGKLSCFQAQTPVCHDEKKHRDQIRRGLHVEAMAGKMPVLDSEQGESCQQNRQTVNQTCGMPQRRMIAAAGKIRCSMSRLLQVKIALPVGPAETE